MCVHEQSISSDHHRIIIINTKNTRREVIHGKERKTGGAVQYVERRAKTEVYKRVIENDLQRAWPGLGDVPRGWAILSGRRERLNLLRDLGLLGLGSGLDGQELGVDRGKDTSLRDGNSSDYRSRIEATNDQHDEREAQARGGKRTKLVQLLVVPDGQLQVSGNDTRLLVVPGGVTGQLEDLGREVLEDGGEVDGGSGSDSL